MKINLGNLGIITGDEKRTLENILPSSLFEQRKNYDEFYINEATVDVNDAYLDITELQKLASHFKVIRL